MEAIKTYILSNIYFEIISHWGLTAKNHEPESQMRHIWNVNFIFSSILMIYNILHFCLITFTFSEVYGPKPHGRKANTQKYSQHKKAEKLNEPEDTVNNQHELLCSFFRDYLKYNQKQHSIFIFHSPLTFMRRKSERCKCSTMIIKK